MLDSMGLDYNNEILGSLVNSHMESLEKSMIFPEIHRVILDKLKDNSYNLSILSNFDYSPTAHKLLDKYNITPYFDTVIISANFGWRKPDLKIFEYAMQQGNKSKSDTIFIGDDLERDIKGAYNAEIDSIYINIRNEESEFNNYIASVKCFEEIINIL